MKLKKLSSPLPVPAGFPLMMRPGPMFSPIEAKHVTFTISGDRLHIQAPRDVIKKIGERLALLGARADPPSPYGPSAERLEGEAR